eukprot:g40833.t1
MLQLRQELAAIFRWAARLDLHEAVCNHFSVAVPAHLPNDLHGKGKAGGAGRFLINPIGSHWSQITASSLALCDAKANLLTESDPVEITAMTIHAAIHASDPSKVAVLHTHQPHITAIGLLQNGRLRMADQNALMFYDRIAYDDVYNGLAHDEKEGARMAKAMGNKDVLLLAHHGVIVCGPTLGEAFTDLYFLERAARLQLLALSTGGKLKEIPQAVIEHTAKQMKHGAADLGRMHLAVIGRILD